MLGTGTAAAAAAAAAAGAAGGGITGGAIGALLGATDHDATKVTKHELERHDVTERDGFVITVETEEASMPGVAEILTDLGATNVTALGGDGSKLRTPLE